MRIAVTSQAKDLSGDIDPRFGRTRYFLLVDTETMGFEVIENTQNLELPQGAGIQAAQNLAEHQPEVVLTGNCGPKAFKTLQAAGIKVVVGVGGRIEKALQSYLRGEYQPATDANVEGHWV
jgi:predicted Fe-Mo cluster-binding NifX family protein